MLQISLPTTPCHRVPYPPATPNLPHPLRPPGPFLDQCSSFLCLEWPLPTLSDVNTPIHHPLLVTWISPTHPCLAQCSTLDSSLTAPHILDKGAYQILLSPLSFYPPWLEGHWIATACPSDSFFPPSPQQPVRSLKTGTRSYSLLHPQRLVGST